MKWLVLCFGALLINGCALKGPKPAVPNEKLGDNGFTFYSPPGENWFYYDTEDGMGYAFIKDLKKAMINDFKETFAVEAKYGFIPFKNNSVEEAQEYYIKEKKARAESQNFRPVEQQFNKESFKGALCFRYFQLVEDIEFSKPDQKIMLSVHGLHCLHPQDKSRFSDLSYTHRYIFGKEGPDFSKEGEGFISNLSFEKVSP